jgi:hypothetical protein
MNAWPSRCSCCGAMAKTVMTTQLHDLSARARRIWHFAHLTKALTGPQQEALRDALARFDMADRAFDAAFKHPTRPAHQQRAVQREWRRLVADAVQSWRALKLDDAVDGGELVE